VTRHLFPRPDLARLAIDIIGNELVASTRLPVNQQFTPPELRNYPECYRVARSAGEEISRSTS
jgi:hypothetical protein